MKKDEKNEQNAEDTKIKKYKNRLISKKNLVVFQVILIKFCTGFTQNLEVATKVHNKHFF